ncbi:hypothetical protein EYC80_003531 [Monilinia laxa]|uniref:Uncharacterized protein n=1 Tax=Monilinia laxa TaxID=61186 RepID=A0A5N6KJY3_MONLA|nr:hypothetical protein EYC80_003531 [Monilinia laxa]
MLLRDTLGETKRGKVTGKIAFPAKFDRVIHDIDIDIDVFDIWSSSIFLIYSTLITLYKCWSVSKNLREGQNPFLLKI